MNTNQANKHFIAIIIPIYNAEAFLPDLISSIKKQTYPTELYEVLLIDNGSSDNSYKILQEYEKELDNVHALQQIKIQGSYATRNFGIEHSKTDILAFTDSDCQPIAQWLENGVSALNEDGVDLVGGNVDFIFSEKATGAEILDSITNMQIEDNVTKRGVAKTANLFVKRHVIDTIGMFNETLKSGGDVIWTQKATDAGFNLVFSKDAVVFHPTRSWKELYVKQLRVGGGRYNVLVNGPGFVSATIREVFQKLKPPSIRKITQNMIEKGREQYITKRWIVWCASYFSSIVTLIGFLSELLKKRGRHL